MTFNLPQGRGPENDQTTEFGLTATSLLVSFRVYY